MIMLLATLRPCRQASSSGAAEEDDSFFEFTPEDWTRTQRAAKEREKVRVGTDFAGGSVRSTVTVFWGSLSACSRTGRARSGQQRSENRWGCVVVQAGLSKLPAQL